MQLFNKLDNNSKLFNKMNDSAKTSFGKIISNSKQNSHSKIGHFITNTPKHNNSIERLAPPVKQSNTHDNRFI